MATPNQPKEDMTSLAERLALIEKKETTRIQNLADYAMDQDETLSREDAEIEAEAMNVMHSISKTRRGHPGLPEITLEHAKSLVKANRQAEKEEKNRRVKVTRSNLKDTLAG